MFADEHAIPSESKKLVDCHSILWYKEIIQMVLAVGVEARQTSTVVRPAIMALIGNVSLTVYLLPSLAAKSSYFGGSEMRRCETE
ncbi:hypothetical protein CDAR_613791 [Caerostris darwini]|uniref:Uncharacterized protein n=1 Tax=Caerostris darwini TaxID=1538125 RepID=A0AAV4MJG0_9ARAC|nr:hypothetical protein CDAR_613791 [Caerostris darwini]